MAQEVCKYSLSKVACNGKSHLIQMQANAKILKTDGFHIWAEVNPILAKTDRYFAVFATGQKIHSGLGPRYIDTFFVGRLVWHLYEVRP